MDEMQLSAAPEEIGEILRKYRTIAVVGLSADVSRPSYQVARYLQNHGYRIVPVNPSCTEILGRKVLSQPQGDPLPGGGGGHLPEG